MLIACNVADPACLSQIPDPDFSHPGSRITDHGSPITDPGSRIPDHGSRITDHGSHIPDQESRITDPGSRIPDLGSRIQKQQQKRGLKKKLVVIPFFVAINFTKWKITLFLLCSG
jgi:hypothetical protein